jgi:hypothetical protein
VILAGYLVVAIDGGGLAIGRVCRATTRNQVIAYSQRVVVFLVFAEYVVYRW